MSNQSEFLTCSQASGVSPSPQRSPTLWPTPEGMGGGKTSRGGDRKGELLLGGMVRDLPASPTPRSNPSPAPSITATFPILSALEASRMLAVIRSLSDAVFCRMLSAEAFPASRTVAPVSDSPAQTSATSGASVGVFLGTFDPASRCSRTSAACLQASQDFFSTAYCQIWPRFGTLVNGRLYRQAPLVPLTGATESGCSAGMNWPTARKEDGESCGNHPGAVDSLTGAVRCWPTPTKQDGENCAGPSQLERNSDPLNVAVLRGQPCPATGPADRANRSTDGSRQGQLNPHWVFCLMGYPPLWAELGRKFTTGSRSSKRQATQSFQK